MSEKFYFASFYPLYLPMLVCTYVHKTRHILLEITDDCIKIHTPATLLGIPRTGLDPLFLPSELP